METAMNNAKSILSALIGTCLATSALTGCDVKKTQSGDVTLPKYQVEKTQEGNVTVPKYEVTPPDITVTEKKTEVTVPKITTEKETVTVPDIDIKTGREKVEERERR
jgi:hypothetical protein